MTRNKTLEHVDSFLVPMDTVGTITSFIQLLSEKAKVDAETRAVIKTAINWIQIQQTMFQQQHLESGASEKILESAEFKFLGVWFLHFEESVRRFGFLPAAAVKQISNGGVAQFHKFVGTIQDDFFKELLCEVETRASRDSAFKSQLAKGEDGIRRLLTNIKRLPNNPATIIFNTAILGPETSRSATSSDDDELITILIVTAVFVAGFLFGLGLGLGSGKS